MTAQIFRPQVARSMFSPSPKRHRLLRPPLSTDRKLQAIRGDGLRTNLLAAPPTSKSGSQSCHRSDRRGRSPEIDNLRTAGWEESSPTLAHTAWRRATTKPSSSPCESSETALPQRRDELRCSSWPARAMASEMSVPGADASASKPVRAQLDRLTAQPQEA